MNVKILTGFRQLVDKDQGVDAVPHRMFEYFQGLASPYLCINTYGNRENEIALKPFCVPKI